MQEVEGEANRWQRILVEHQDRSLSAFVVAKERSELDRARRALQQRPDVIAATETLFPDREAEKRTLLKPLCNRLAGVQVGPAVPSTPLQLRRQVWNFRQTIRKFARSHPEAGAALAGLEQEADRLYRTLRGLSPEQFEQRVEAVEQALHSRLQSDWPRVQRWFCPPDTVTLDRVPAALRQRFLGKHGSFALAVYPARNAWEKEHLEEFVRVVREIEPQAVGELISLYENGQSIVRSFLQASAYSLAAILTLLLVWQRSLRRTLLMLLPLAVGVAPLLVLMRTLSLPWNFANFFALPILIGIGVDSGIHLVAAWRTRERATFKNALLAVTLSALTTTIGFGILATGAHLGVRSLGLILALGIGLCLLVSLTVLPAACALVEPKE